MICFALVMPNLSNREIGIVSILTFVAIIAHLLNLGVTPLMADEAIRANVAWEMIASKNYIVPTMWGDFYYRKPPLYNWVIIGFFQAFNSYSEFVFRLPSVIPLFILSFATWFVSRNHIGERAAAIAAFGFLLSGRLLTRDSLLGHIDIAFSLVTFIGSLPNKLRAGGNRSAYERLTFFFVSRIHGRPMVNISARLEKAIFAVSLRWYCCFSFDCCRLFLHL
jgi:hypothetical protein